LPTFINSTGSLGNIRGVLTTNDADMFAINICDAANFRATTVNGTTADTQIFLFDSNGIGVTFNDDNDSPRSTITATFVAGNGNHLLALSRYDRDPVDAGGLALWNDTPFSNQRAPDGPGAARAVAAWQGTNSGSASYTIALTGACRAGGAPVCVADFDDGSGTGTRDGGVDINDLLYYQLIYQNGLAAADIDDGSGSGTRDGGVDINDLLYYVIRFEAGC
jgi:hypothetical protein